MPKRQPTRLAKGISAVRRSIKTLDRSLRRLEQKVGALERRAKAGARERPARRRPVLSPRQRAALKLQGRYMGYIRQLSPRGKARVRTRRAAKGVRAAIALARRLAKR